MACAGHVCLYEAGGVPYRAVDMRLRGEVHDCPWSVGTENRLDCPGIANIRVDERKLCAIKNGFQTRQVPGVGQFVHDDDRLIALSYPVECKVRPYESRAAGIQDCHRIASRVRSPPIVPFG